MSRLTEPQHSPRGRAWDWLLTGWLGLMSAAGSIGIAGWISDLVDSTNREVNNTILLVAFLHALLLPVLAIRVVRSFYRHGVQVGAASRGSPEGGDNPSHG